MNWLIGKILGFVGGKLDGHKTKISGAAFILLGVLGFLSQTFPDQGLPAVSTEQSLAYIATGMGLLGIGGKLEKARPGPNPAAPQPAQEQKSKESKWTGTPPGGSFLPG
jgi:hypothetical protein